MAFEFVSTECSIQGQIISSRFSLYVRRKFSSLHNLRKQLPIRILHHQPELRMDLEELGWLKLRW
jgi:hypothetical protein